MSTHVVYFVRGAKHAAMCSLSVASLFMSRAFLGSVHVLTDQDPDLLRPYLDNEIPAFRIDTFGAPIMLANLEAQVSALDMLPRDSRVLFLDTDTLLVHSFDFTDADLTVTWRAHALEDDEGKPVVAVADRMPYNYGVIAVNNTYEARQAFVWMRERVRVMSPQLQKWYGNQIALAGLAGPRPEVGERTVRRRIAWTPTERGHELSIRQVPCETYNYTPQREGEDTTSRVVLHFKGKKRRLMRDYAESMGLVWPAILSEAA